jgi:hypothetical protein
MAVAKGQIADRHGWLTKLPQPAVASH